MTNPKISIIMPVYNSEKYLGEAIDSVLRQTLRDFELLLIDDGSTDHCGYICDEYASRDSRIVAIHKKNGGVCSARNLGIKKSHADLITFIDNDDYYEKRFLEIMIEKMKETDADYIKCGRRNIFLKTNGDMIDERVFSYDSEKVLCFEDFIQKYPVLRSKMYLSSVWNGIYKKNIITANGLLFKEDVKHGQEDVLFNCQYEQYCKSFLFLPDVLYVHYIRIGHSTSAKFYANIVFDMLDVADLELKLVESNRSIYDLVQLQCLRECYATLSPLRKKERKPYIKAIEERLDKSILKTYSVLGTHDLSVKAKIDLLTIKYGMADMLFFSRFIHKQYKTIRSVAMKTLSTKPKTGEGGIIP